MSWNLPPLPQRTHGFDAEPLYTADQMRAYASDRIEAQAARIAELEAALMAMLTHMGMDEDEWNKPTFDQARAALAPKESA